MGINRKQQPRVLPGWLKGKRMVLVAVIIQAGKEVDTMPKGNRTGPMGMGPRTGRGAGFCSGFAVPGYAKPVGFGGGFGRGFGGGFGRGFGRMFFAGGFPGWGYFGYPAAVPPAYAAPYGYEPAAGEKELLSQQAEYLEAQLQQVKKRLEEMKEDAE
jgi:hypothetical protein